MKPIALLAALLCAGALAQPAAPQAGGEPPHRGPPPEALKACEGKKAADACSFTSPRGKAEGSCWAPQGKPLACRPKDAPAPPQKP